MKHLKVVSVGQALALLANFRLGWKERKTYLIMNYDRNFFITLEPGDNVFIKLSFFVTDAATIS